MGIPRLCIGTNNVRSWAHAIFEVNLDREIWDIVDDQWCQSRHVDFNVWVPIFLTSARFARSMIVTT